MSKWIRELDELVRGRKSDPRLLAGGTEHLSLGVCCLWSVLLGGIYGASMGCFR